MSRDYGKTLEIEGPTVTCGHCRFGSALDGKFSVEDGLLVWRAAPDPQPRRGPDLDSCCESSPVVEFEHIMAGDEDLGAEDKQLIKSFHLLTSKPVIRLVIDAMGTTAWSFLLNNTSLVSWSITSATLDFRASASCSPCKPASCPNEG